MTSFSFSFCGAGLRALGSGALHWPDQSLLVVSDLHFGKSARLSAVGGAQLPPYDTVETLTRLEADIEATQPARVMCLGDSFDAAGLDRLLPEAEQLWITRLQAGRSWVWIEGNHDPGPVALGGTHLAQMQIGPLVFRHIASAPGSAETGEVSGHYHPKIRLALKGRSLSRPCFAFDSARLILPAYGAYTGGLSVTRAPLRGLLGPRAHAILTGPKPAAVPLSRAT